MGLRCWPGCRAMVANVTNEDVRPYLGRVVTCLSVDDMDCWATSPELKEGASVYDGALTPITPPPAAETVDTREPIAAEV